jgi:uncharacterized membrane-anchored protein
MPIGRYWWFHIEGLMKVMKQFSYMDCKAHPLRTTLYDELHIRPFHIVTTPQKISHLVFRSLKHEQEQAFEQLCELCSRHNVLPPGPKTSSFLQDFGEFTLQWESHVEFYSITIMRSCGRESDLFDHPAIEHLPADWLSSQTGEVVAAFHLAVIDDQHNVDESALCRHFESNPVSISETAEGNATLYTAFRLHTDGFGRFVVLNQGMPDEQMGRLTRRLTEMETYRLFAMLALPLAKQIAPQLVEMDQELARILAGLAKISSIEEERELLLKLSQLESRLETWRAETNRRFSGAKAYHEMIQDRLARIAENKVACNSTLGEFMCRRLDPALRTCTSVHTWMEDLSKRIERASDLLRTRINLTLQEQNRTLLATMNRRSRLQFRLQETVEGLSVVAISYYLVGLIKYLLEGLPLKHWGLSKDILIAITIPLVLVSVLMLTRRIKGRLIKQPVQ